MISTQIIFFPHVKKKQSRKTFESLCLHNVSLEHLFVLNQMTAAFLASTFWPHCQIIKCLMHCLPKFKTYFTHVLKRKTWVVDSGNEACAENGSPMKNHLSFYRLIRLVFPKAWKANTQRNSMLKDIDFRINLYIFMSFFLFLSFLLFAGW